jgi:hypothetical protein
MEAIFRQGLAKLGLEKCQKSILALDFNDVQCVKLTVSKILSMVRIVKNSEEMLGWLVVIVICSVKVERNN